MADLPFSGFIDILYASHRQDNRNVHYRPWECRAPCPSPFVFLHSFHYSTIDKTSHERYYALTHCAQRCRYWIHQHSTSCSANMQPYVEFGNDPEYCKIAALLSVEVVEFAIKHSHAVLGIPEQRLVLGHERRVKRL